MLNADNTDVFFMLFLKGGLFELYNACLLGHKVIPLFNCTFAVLL